MGVLSGRVAIVTAGAGPGMGSAFSKALAKEGAAVCVADIKGDLAEKIAAEIRIDGGVAIAAECDVAHAGQVESMVGRAVRELGPIGILANHAGISPSGPITDMTEAQWDRAMAVHLKGAFLCTRAVVPHMKALGWGRIVSTSSRAAYRPSRHIRGMCDYAAAKAGLLGFSRALAVELGPFGITVNAISPGLVSGSGLLDGGHAMTPEEEEAASNAEGQVLPLRYARPEELAGALLYLVGPHSDRVTGVVMHVNNGSYFPA